ncbi:hypothetical protein DIPPA_14618 [Diplonema papillatum]|nr:hypothetical protein DIPPA_14618 [Diplonema papillatum]
MYDGTLVFLTPEGASPIRTPGTRRPEVSSPNRTPSSRCVCRLVEAGTQPGPCLIHPHRTLSSSPVHPPPERPPSVDSDSRSGVPNVAPSSVPVNSDKKPAKDRRVAKGTARSASHGKQPVLGLQQMQATAIHGKQGKATGRAGSPPTPTSAAAKQQDGARLQNPSSGRGASPPFSTSPGVAVAAKVRTGLAQPQPARGRVPAAAAHSGRPSSMSADGRRQAASPPRTVHKPPSTSSANPNPRRSSVPADRRASPSSSADGRIHRPPANPASHPRQSNRHPSPSSPAGGRVPKPLSSHPRQSSTSTHRRPNPSSADGQVHNAPSNPASHPRQSSTSTHRRASPSSSPADGRVHNHPVPHPRQGTSTRRHSSTSPSGDEGRRIASPGGGVRRPPASSGQGGGGRRSPSSPGKGGRAVGQCAVYKAPSAEVPLLRSSSSAADARRRRTSPHTSAYHPPRATSRSATAVDVEYISMPNSVVLHRTVSGSAGASFPFVEVPEAGAKTPPPRREQSASSSPPGRESASDFRVRRVGTPGAESDGGGSKVRAAMTQAVTRGADVFREHSLRQLSSGGAHAAEMLEAAEKLVRPALSANLVSTPSHTTFSPPFAFTPPTERRGTLPVGSSPAVGDAVEVYGCLERVNDACARVLSEGTQRSGSLAEEARLAEQRVTRVIDTFEEIVRHMDVFAISLKQELAAAKAQTGARTGDLHKVVERQEAELHTLRKAFSVSQAALKIRSAYADVAALSNHHDHHHNPRPGLPSSPPPTHSAVHPDQRGISPPRHPSPHRSLADPPASPQGEAASRSLSPPYQYQKPWKPVGGGYLHDNGIK